MHQPQDRSADCQQRASLQGVPFLPGHSDHEAGGTCIFNVEEADDEAIIDTGASKAVIERNVCLGC